MDKRESDMDKIKRIENLPHEMQAMLGKFVMFSSAGMKEMFAIGAIFGFCIGLNISLKVNYLILACTAIAMLFIAGVAINVKEVSALRRLNIGENGDVKW